MSSPIWIDEKELSRRTGLKVQTLRNWRHLGKGPAYSKLGRSVRYNVADAEAYFQNRRVDPENMVTIQDGSDHEYQTWDNNCQLTPTKTVYVEGLQKLMRNFTDTVQ